MADLIPWPFALPDRFLDALGYPRVVEAFDSPAMRARLTELLRRQGIAEPQPMSTGPGASSPSTGSQPATSSPSPTASTAAPASCSTGSGSTTCMAAPPVCHRRCSVPSSPGWSSTGSAWARATPRPRTRWSSTPTQERRGSRRSRSPTASSGLNHSPRSNSNDPWAPTPRPIIHTCCPPTPPYKFARSAGSRWGGGSPMGKRGRVWGTTWVPQRGESEGRATRVRLGLSLSSGIGRLLIAIATELATFAR
jgi:hypothetical protein